VAPVRTISDYSYAANASRAMAGLIGDAAAFIDPVLTACTGMLGGFRAAEAIDRPRGNRVTRRALRLRALLRRGRSVCA
jgi:hypothetical protein